MTTQANQVAESGRSGTRIERDSHGAIEVDARRLWGAQTERSLRRFPIGRPSYIWDRNVIQAFGWVKKAAALANRSTGVLDNTTTDLIVRAATEIIAGHHDEDFPLVVFQTGSGTHSNMNANEVIANRANQLAGFDLGAKEPVHPNDHVNASQSSNDVFPTVMHLAVVHQLHQGLYPAMETLTATLDKHSQAHADLVKMGRTHLQDATPITFGREIDGWAGQIRQAVATLHHLEPALHKLAIGGTATGTGLNAPPRFADHVVVELSRELEIGFIETENHFAAAAAHDPVVNISAALRTLAGALMKMSNDIRLLSSGPRTGIGELKIPANEPGSSIMPGKVNPTQAEALNMVAAHVFGNDATVAFAGTQGELQLNVHKPIILHRTLDSINLIADAATAFTRNCLVGLEPNGERITANLEANLMAITALVPVLGYEQAASIAAKAHHHGLTLKEAVIQDGSLTADQFDDQINLLQLARPHHDLSHDRNITGP